MKESLPAYLDPNLQLKDLLTGVCFASSGSGYDPLTAKLQVHLYIISYHTSLFSSNSIFIRMSCHYQNN